MGDKGGKLRSAEPQLGHSSDALAKQGLGVPVPIPTPRWYSRGYLPHYDDVSRLQSITFRLADSLPQSVLRAMDAELESLPDTEQAAQRRLKIEAYLDAGIGCCALRHSAMATVMQETLLKFDGEKYQLLEWCIMPNHVHVLIQPKIGLGKILQSWKSFTGRWALKRNADLGLGVPGKTFWMREYWDRYIRNERHLEQAIDYIHNNPVKAKLCKAPEDWPWGSAAVGAPSPSSATLQGFAE